MFLPRPAELRVGPWLRLRPGWACAPAACAGGPPGSRGRQGLPTAAAPGPPELRSEAPSRGTITAQGSRVGAGRPRCSRRSCLLCTGAWGPDEGLGLQPASSCPEKASFLRKTDLSVPHNPLVCRDTGDRKLGVLRKPGHFRMFTF